jgi:hypothetical protein
MNLLCLNPPFEEDFMTTKTFLEHKAYGLEKDLRE